MENTQNYSTPPKICIPLQSKARHYIVANIPEHLRNQPQPPTFQYMKDLIKEQSKHIKIIRPIENPANTPDYIQTPIEKPKYQHFSKKSSVNSHEISYEEPSSASTTGKTMDYINQNSHNNDLLINGAITAYKGFVKLTHCKKIKIIKYNGEMEISMRNRTPEPFGSTKIKRNDYSNINDSPHIFNKSKHSNGSRIIIRDIDIVPQRPIIPTTVPLETIEKVEFIEETPLVMDLDKTGERTENLLLPYANRVILQKSIYKDRPPTVFFAYPKCCKMIRKMERTIIYSQEELKDKYLSFAISETTTPYKVICKVLKYAGFRVSRSSHWNLLWTGAIKSDLVMPLNPMQRTNHFPGIFQIGRKDNLCRNINRLKRIHGKDYNICPTTYVLPEDLGRFSKDRDTAEGKTQLWILKPSAQSCGRGIRLIGPKTVLGVKEYFFKLC